MPRKPRGITWHGFGDLGLSMPDVTEDAAYRMPALYVRKTLVALLKEDGVTLVPRVDLVDSDILLHADPEAFFQTDHDVGYPWTLVRRSNVRRTMLADFSGETSNGF